MATRVCFIFLLVTFALFVSVASFTISIGNRGILPIWFQQESVSVHTLPKQSFHLARPHLVIFPYQAYEFSLVNNSETISYALLKLGYDKVSPVYSSWNPSIKRGEKIVREAVTDSSGNISNISFAHTQYQLLPEVILLAAEPNETLSLVEIPGQLDNRYFIIQNNSRHNSLNLNHSTIFDELFSMRDRQTINLMLLTVPKYISNQLSAKDNSSEKSISYLLKTEQKFTINLKSTDYRVAYNGQSCMVAILEKFICRNIVQIGLPTDKCFEVRIEQFGILNQTQRRFQQKYFEYSLGFTSAIKHFSLIHDLDHFQLLLGDEKIINLMTLKEVDSTFTIIERVEPNQIILEASLLSNARLLILTKNETNTTLSIEHYSKVNNNCSELCTLTVIRPQSFVYQRSPLLFGTLDKESWLVVEKESCNIIPVTRLAESYQESYALIRKVYFDFSIQIQIEENSIQIEETYLQNRQRQSLRVNHSQQACTNPGRLYHYSSYLFANNSTTHQNSLLQLQANWHIAPTLYQILRQQGEINPIIGHPNVLANTENCRLLSNADGTKNYNLLIDPRPTWKVCAISFQPMETSELKINASKLYIFLSHYQMIIYWIKVQPYNPANKYEGKNIISNGSNETSVEFRMNNRYQYQIYIIKTTEQDSPAQPLSLCIENVGIDLFRIISFFFSCAIVVMGAIVIFFHFKFDLSVLLVRLNLVAKYQGPWNYPLTRKTTRESLINLCAENCVKYYRCYFMGRHKGPNDFQCSICMSAIRCFDMVMETYCQHRYHARCFATCVRSQANLRCPYCRREFTREACLEFMSNQLAKKIA